MLYSLKIQQSSVPHWSKMKNISLMQRIWCINCSLHKLWVSFCDLRVIPVGKFQRDFFVECILFCANISSGIPHRKCANKSHSKGCNFPWELKGQNASFLVQLSWKQFILTFLSQLEQLLHLSNLSQRLLKLDVIASRGNFVL